MRKKIFLKRQKLIVRSFIILLVVIFLSPAMVSAQAKFKVVHRATAPRIDSNFIVVVKDEGTNNLVGGAMVSLIKDEVTVASDSTEVSLP